MNCTIPSGIDVLLSLFKYSIISLVYELTILTNKYTDTQQHNIHIITG